jgi:hypothetical protein
MVDQAIDRLRELERSQHRKIGLLIVEECGIFFGRDITHSQNAATKFGQTVVVVHLLPAIRAAGRSTKG